jgi:hypothetical protein
MRSSEERNPAEPITTGVGPGNAPTERTPPPQIIAAVDFGTPVEPVDLDQLRKDPTGPANARLDMADALVADALACAMSLGPLLKSGWHQVQASYERPDGQIQFMGMGFADSPLEPGEVPAEALIKIKHLVDDLRSALDYAATEVVEHYKLKPKNDKHLSFPIAKNPGHFRTICAQSFPGLSRKAPNVVSLLESIQAYSPSGMNRILPHWLSDLHLLWNTSKHTQLTRQIPDQPHALKRDVARDSGTNVKFNGTQLYFRDVDQPVVIFIQVIPSEVADWIGSLRKILLSSAAGTSVSR